MPQPPLFIFDCDGTLLDSMGMWLSIQPKLLATYGVETTPEDFASFESLPMEAECQAYHDTWGVGESGADILARLDSMLNEEYRTHIRPRRGVRAFLDAAEAAGIPLGIATSTAEHLVRAGLAANGLERFFCAIVTTGMAGRSKDFPDVYDLARERTADAAGIAVPPREAVWVFEDAPFGLKSSGEAGYRTAGIYDPRGRGKRDDVYALADIAIDSFEDLTLEGICLYDQKTAAYGE